MKKENIITDISNIAGHFNVFPPKIENIHKMFTTLKCQYWVLGMADWKLFSYIDSPESYREYIAKRIIIEAPPHIPADILMIIEAIKSDSLIVTNDKLKDHTYIFVSESWIECHRVPFDIIDGEFIIYLP